MPRFRQFAALLCLAAAALPAAADGFARIDEALPGQPRALQLAIVTYAPADARDFSVDLISAIHIGDREYYQLLNERFRAYDVLLFELVVADPDSAGELNDFDGSWLSRLQVGLKDLLGLAFQLDEIDYGAPNFVHADLSSTMLARSMEERGESLYVYFWRLFFAGIEDYARDPLGLREMSAMTSILAARDDDALKIAIAYEMVKATESGDLLGGEQGSALIAARNEHAMRVLHEQLSRGARRIGLFYGAAHMNDFEQRLAAELGLQRVAVEWADAWRFSAADAPAR